MHQDRQLEVLLSFISKSLFLGVRRARQRWPPAPPLAQLAASVSNGQTPPPPASSAFVGGSPSPLPGPPAKSAAEQTLDRAEELSAMVEEVGGSTSRPLESSKSVAKSETQKRGKPLLEVTSNVSSETLVELVSIQEGGGELELLSSATGELERPDAGANGDREVGHEVGNPALPPVQSIVLARHGMVILQSMQLRLTSELATLVGEFQV